MDPTTMLVSAGLSGIGSYFGSDAEKQAMEDQMKIQQEQLDWQKQQAELAQKGAAAAGGVVQSGINTGGYGQTLNYTDPNAGAVNSTLQTFLSGGLTDAEKTQMGMDIKTGAQGIGANAATSGMPAGALAGALNQNNAAVSGNYANMASARMGQGLSAAPGISSAGQNVAGSNYQSGLNNWLNSQQQQNLKTQMLAGYTANAGGATV